MEGLFSVRSARCVYALGALVTVASLVVSNNAVYLLSSATVAVAAMLEIAAARRQAHRVPAVAKVALGCSVSLLASVLALVGFYWLLTRNAH